MYVNIMCLCVCLCAYVRTEKGRGVEGMRGTKMLLLLLKEGKSQNIDEVLFEWKYAYVVC